jgi:hypothetical protein
MRSRGHIYTYLDTRARAVVSQCVRMQREALTIYCTCVWHGFGQHMGKNDDEEEHW